MIYSIENAKKFNWSSISGNLYSERVSYLEMYLLGEKVLDAGCGGGAYVEFLCHKGLDVTGIDKYEEFLQVAREERRHGTYVQGDLTNLPFLDKTFDSTYCFDVLEHIDDQLAIQELVRVTKKRLIIAVPKEDVVMSSFGLTFFHYQDKTHLRNYTKNSILELCSKVSFSEIEIIPELPIPSKRLVFELIDFQSLNSSPRAIKKRIINSILIRLLSKISYKQIFTGLLCIITF